MVTGSRQKGPKKWNSKGLWAAAAKNHEAYAKFSANSWTAKHSTPALEKAGDVVDTSTLTALLVAWSNGDQGAFERIVPQVYPTLRQLAHRYNATEPQQTFNSGDLVQEAFLQLMKARSLKISDRRHFFALASKMMRQILVDRARKRTSNKRGGTPKRIPLEDVVGVFAERRLDPDVLIAIDEALEKLRRVASRRADVVELRFFGGLDEKETAAVLDVSVQTLQRDWRLAKAFLLREITGGPSSE